VILYEYPFNERIRTYLRLQHLLDRLDVLIPRVSPIDHHFALVTLFEIMDVATRADLKSEVLKDLERQKQVLNGYRGNPAISERALDEIIAGLDHCFADLAALSGKTGHTLTENDWLMSVRSRAAIPGGTFEFDLPSYHAWQHLDAEDRQRDLQAWTACLQPLARSVRMLLRMLRESGMPQRVVATAGQFQQTLPQGKTFQLLRLRLAPELGLVPEISGNRLLVSVRLLRMGPENRLVATHDDVSFDLTLCA
jgi:cell division protein ZapD